MSTDPGRLLPVNGKEGRNRKKRKRNDCEFCYEKSYEFVIAFFGDLGSNVARLSLFGSDVRTKN